ncbi:MAG: hypothetical protein J6Y42_01190 [Bacilli bacterium]|nr:hypothetical protein [Bacilli bacterium]
MKEEILNEISDFCNNECPSHSNCSEEDCVLYRIEKIILEEVEVNENSNNQIQRECEITKESSL